MAKYILALVALAGLAGRAQNLSELPRRPAAESVGNKLRRLARSAAISNPLINTPLIAPSAWVLSTAYTAGKIVTNGGNSYICTVAGTSAGSGGPTGTGVAPITDNTVTWYYNGAPTPTATAAGAPTITDGTATPGALTLGYVIPGNASSFAFYGGVPTVFATNFYAFAGVTASATQSGNTAGTAHSYTNGAAVSFWTDAPKLDILNYGSQPYRVIVDGAYVSASGGTAIFTVTTGHTIIDYSSSGAGGRKSRLYTIEGTRDWYFGGVYVDPASKVWAPASGERVRVAFVTDSYGFGANSIPVLSGELLPQAVGAYLGWADVWNMGVPGTGYINQGSGNNFYTFGQRISDATGNSPDLVVAAGCLNDASFSAGAIQAAALAYFRGIRTALPTVPIIVLGCWPASTGPSSFVLAAENAVSAAVTAFADPLTYFVPISTDTTGAWVSGTGNVSAITGTGNADVYVQPDGTHLTELGFRNYLAARAAAAIRPIIQRIP